MKKLLFTLGVMMVGMTASAQEQSEGYQLPDGFMSVELQANPFSNDFNMFKMAEFKVRLFLDAKNVVRLKVGLGYDNDTDETTTDYDSRKVTNQDASDYYTSTTNNSTKSKQTALKLALGYENHFVNTGRLDFYAGAEVGWEAKFYSGNINSTSRVITHNGSDITETLEYSKYSFDKMSPMDVPEGFLAPSITDQDAPTLDYSQAKHNENILFASLFTGVDFFIYKGLYIGTELGVSFKTGKQKSGSWTYESLDASTGYKTIFDSKTGNLIQINPTYKGNNGDKGVVQTEKRYVDHFTSKSSNLKVYVEPALRIGWFF